MTYRQMMGYVLEDKNIHVCGYEREKIIIQNRKHGIIEPRKYQLHTNTKGTYFNFQGKRIFVVKQ